MRTVKSTIVAEAPDGRVHRIKVPPAVAWSAARGIADGTHYAVELHGRYGSAKFNLDRSVDVVWNGDSTTPGETCHYGRNVVPCIC